MGESLRLCRQPLLLSKCGSGAFERPQVEEQVLKDVESYGKQLGRMSDALRVLLDRLDETGLSKKERKAIRAFLPMLDEIGDIKRPKGRAAALNGEAQ